MRYIILVIFIHFYMNVSAQNNFSRSIDAENSAIVFNGSFNFDALNNESTFSWFQSGTNTYQPSPEIITKLKEALLPYDITLVLGTWCEDSQNLVPKFYKTLLAVSYPADSVQIIGVDRAKKTVSGIHEYYNVDKVPTIVVSYNEKEIGRIVEVVTISIEEDLLKIITSGKHQ